MEPNEPTSITLDILKKIHEGMGELRRSVDDLRHEVRGNSLRLDAVEGQLKSQGKRIGGVETRMHELVQVTTLSISRQFDFGHRVDAIEERVAALESRQSASEVPSSR
jgi:hypothetical protein